MLDPRARRMLLSSLKPPEGFRFDCAIGTTYSLDLIALLTAPLGLAAFDWHDDEGRLASDPAARDSDPLGLLESLRRCADRVHIYCHAGQIKVPPANQRLLSYLEGSVIEVLPPSAKRGEGGLFHPKVWVLRYVGADGVADHADRVRYRLLCLSRNLTFDRSWDTVFVLEGEKADRSRAIAMNHPLAGFVKDLPSLAVRSSALSVQAVADTATIARELAVVKWEIPEWVDEIRFWPLGMQGKPSWPFPDRIDQLLVVAPFVREVFLGKFAAKGTARMLVSRSETLRELDPAVLRDTWNCFTLQEGCDASVDTDEGDEGSTATLSGLHAKLFVVDAGRNAHVWTGSANATTAAFEQNVEFLVELTGKRSALGVDAIVGHDQKVPNLWPMLAAYTPHDAALAPDKDAKECEAIVASLRAELVRSSMALRAEPSGPGDASFMTVLALNAPLQLADAASVRCRLITLAGDGVELDPARIERVAFGPHSADSISSFVAFEIMAKVGGAEHRESFVLNLPLSGAPADRRERVLCDLLRDPRRLIRYLLMLLSDDPEALFTELRSGTVAGEGGQGRSDHDGLPLLEHILAALHRNPEKLQHVERLIAELRKAPDARSVLSQELDELWTTINEVRIADPRCAPRKVR
jgi:PLD-like domain